jgi:predicted transcriptional regulator of viral defense system
MDTNNALSKLSILLAKHSFTSKEAKALGVTSEQIAYYVAKKRIKRLARGVYQGIATAEAAPFEWEDLLVALKGIPSGVVCLITALAIYAITDEIPRRYDIAIPHASFPIKRDNIRIVRMRDHETGRSTTKLGDIEIDIYDVERCIIDSFRLLDIEVALKALKMAMARNMINYRKITKYARKFGVHITPYIQAINI